MEAGRSLYEEDLVRWSRQQSDALKAAAAAGANLHLDWEHLAEEIDSLGRSQRRELASRIAVVLEHLLKLMAATGPDPRPGWRDTVRRERAEIRRLLADSPSLRGLVQATVEEERREAAALAIAPLIDHGGGDETDRARLRDAVLTPEQVTGEWIPDTERDPA